MVQTTFCEFKYSNGAISDCLHSSVWLWYDPLASISISSCRWRLEIVVCWWLSTSGIPRSASSHEVQKHIKLNRICWNSPINLPNTKTKQTLTPVGRHRYSFETGDIAIAGYCVMKIKTFSIIHEPPDPWTEPPGCGRGCRRSVRATQYVCTCLKGSSPSWLPVSGG